MPVFRFLVVPLKAILMNLLSVGAAYGLMVAVFQKRSRSTGSFVPASRPDSNPGPMPRAAQRCHSTFGLREVIKSDNTELREGGAIWARSSPWTERRKVGHRQSATSGRLCGYETARPGTDRSRVSS